MEQWTYRSLCSEYAPVLQGRWNIPQRKVCYRHLPERNMMQVPVLILCLHRLLVVLDRCARLAPH